MTNVIAKKGGEWLYLSILGLTAVIAVLVAPDYALWVFFSVIVASIIFFYPEISYYLAVLTISVELLFIDFFVRTSMHDCIFFAHLLLIIAFISWVFARMAGTRDKAPTYGLEYLIGFFMIFCAISFLWSEDRIHGSVELFILCASLSALILSIAFLKNKQTINIVLWIFIFMGIVNSVIALYSLHSQYEGTVLYQYQDFSLKMTFNPIRLAFKGHGLLPPPATAFFLNLTLFLAFGKLLSSTNLKTRILLFFIIMTIFAGHMTTLSKSALLGLLAGFIFLIINEDTLKKWFFTSAFILIAVIVFSFVISHIDTLYKTINYGVFRAVSPSEGTTSLSTRITFWTIGTDLLIKSDGLGTGIGGYKQNNVFWPHAHSIYFSTLFELGFIGLWAWLFILGEVLRRLLNSLKKCTDKYWRSILLGYIGGYISMLITGLFDFEYEYSIIWLYIGIGIALNVIIEKQTAKKNPQKLSF
jgi:O-antigen ligase